MAEMSLEHVLLFGGVPWDYLHRWEITSDLPLAEQKMGVHFMEVSTERLRERMQNLTEREGETVRRVTRQLVTQAVPNPQGTPPDEGTIAKAVGLYAAMNHFVEAHQASAVTIVCSPWIRDADIVTPCVALMLLQEDGVPAACQGDIDALLTMVLFKRVAGVMSVMGNNFEVEGQLGVGHCVLPRGFCGESSALHPYYIGDYHGRKPSPTVHPLLPANQEVTIARLTKNLEKLILTSGVVVDNIDLPERCRNTLVIQVADPARVLGAMKGLQQHLVVACGDHMRSLTEYAQTQGIKVLVV